MEVLQRIDEVLLHLHVQGVLHLAELTHGFPDVNESETLKDKGFSLPAQVSICSLLPWLELCAKQTIKEVSPKLDSSPSSRPNFCMDSPRTASVCV